jgi:hypothetical protein
MLGVVGVLLLVVVVLLCSALAQIKRLAESVDAVLAGRAAAEPPAPAASESNGSRQRQFDAFLAEAPERAILPKREQFAAFRQWRQENGLTWGR